MSAHLIEIIKIEELLPHPNADKLDVIKIHGWTCCVKKGDFKVGDLAAYIPPDYVVDTTRPEFSWLHKEGFTKHRVRVQKLRGIVSQGFLVPAPDDAVLGDNWLERLGVERYEPQIAGLATGGQAIAGPPGYYPVYDVENYYARNSLLTEGDDVIITEKLHGSSGRFVFAEDKMWCGSRKEWKQDTPENLWWRCLRSNPWIEEICRQNPNFVLYGEVIGVQGGFPYGKQNDNVPFRVFDVLYKDEWLSVGVANSIVALNDITGKVTSGRWVPILYQGPFNKEQAIALAEGKTTVDNASHIREGIVIEAVPQRFHPRYGRVKLKIVGAGYLMKS